MPSKYFTQVNQTVTAENPGRGVSSDIVHIWPLVSRDLDNERGLNILNILSPKVGFSFGTGPTQWDIMFAFVFLGHPG